MKLTKYDTQETLQEYVAENIDETDDHWIWKGKTKLTSNYMVKGYALVSGRTVMASRLAWTAFHGDIPAKIHVRNCCGTDLCVKPYDHHHELPSERIAQYQQTVTTDSTALMTDMSGPFIPNLDFATNATTVAQYLNVTAAANTFTTSNNLTTDATLVGVQPTTTASYGLSPYAGAYTKQVIFHEGDYAITNENVMVYTGNEWTVQKIAVTFPVAEDPVECTCEGEFPSPFCAVHEMGIEEPAMQSTHIQEHHDPITDHVLDEWAQWEEV